MVIFKGALFYRWHNAFLWLALWFLIVILNQCSLGDMYMYVMQAKLEEITCTFSAKSCYPCLVNIHEEIGTRDESMDNREFMETGWLIKGLLLRGAGMEQW